MLSAFVLFLTNVCFSQFDSLLTEPFYKQLSTLDALRFNVGGSNKKSQDKLKRFYQFTNKHSNPALRLEARILNAFQLWKTNPKSIDSAIDSLNMIISFATKNGYWIQELRAYQNLSFIYWGDQNYTLLFENQHATEKALNHIATRIKTKEDRLNYNLVATTAYLYIGQSYYFFKDDKKALYYLKKTVPLPINKFFIYPKLRSWNMLGLTYRSLKEYKKSAYYFKKIIQTTTKKTPAFYAAIASGNLGSVYYKTGRYKEALPLLQKDITVSKKYGIYGEAMICSIRMGAIYLRQGKLQQSKDFLIQADKLHVKSSHDDKIHYTYILFKEWSKWYATKGNGELAKKYLDSTLDALQQHNENFNALKLMRAEQKIQHQKEQFLQKEKEQELYKRNLIIGIIIFIFILLVILYIYKNKYNQRKLELKELTIAFSKEDLKNAQNELQVLSQKVKDNNKLIVQLKGTNQEKNHEIIQELKNCNILTTEDWNYYQDLFTKVFPHFMRTLKETYTQLTIGDIRCLCLMKLQLSNKEIASILGVSDNSIRVSIHRIKKKLGINDKSELQEIVNKL